MNEFIIPDGSYFDPDFGLDIDSNNWNPLEEWNSLRDRANKRLNKYGYTAITEEDINLPIKYIASEVGDDEQLLSNSKAFVSLVSVFHEELGMKISEKDTSINSRFGNLAEDLVVLPDGYYQTYHNARNTSGYNQMSYLDVPKLRLALSVRPGRMDHSATNDGKASLVGARNSWIPPDSPIKGIYEIFSLYQDLHLGLVRDKRFAYMPQALGGYGKPIPFGTPSNWNSFNAAFRGGTYKAINNEVARRCVNYLHNESLGIRQKKDLLLSHIVRFESSYHDWIKNRSIYAPVTWINIPPELNRFLAGQTSEDRRLNTAFSRLVAENKLITSRKLEIAIEHNALCKALLATDSIESFKSLRDSKVAEWRQCSMYTLEQAGYIRSLSLSGMGDKVLRPLEVLRFYNLVKTKGNLLRQTLKEEGYYYPEVMEEIYDKGPMKVDFRFYPKLSSTTRMVAEVPERDVHDTEEIGVLTQLLDWVRGPRTEPMPRTMVNDDDAIIAEADPRIVQLLVTEDKALCRDLNRIVGCPVIRIPVTWYYRALYFGDTPRPWEAAIARRFPSFEFKTIEDSGSIKSAEELMFYDGSMMNGRITQPFGWNKLLSDKDEILLPDVLEQYDDQPPAGPPDIYDRHNLLKYRKNWRGPRPRNPKT